MPLSSCDSPSTSLSAPSSLSLDLVAVAEVIPTDFSSLFGAVSAALVLRFRKVDWMLPMRLFPPEKKRDLFFLGGASSSIFSDS
jgi:hypothetical protein